MTISNSDKAILQFLTYAAQFSHPMKNGIKRVFDTLILPKLPFQSPAHSLNQIIHLLKLKDSFEAIVPTTTGHSDTEIRDFLMTLADEIEIRYPAYRRSGKSATIAGTWQQFGVPDHLLILEKDHILPNDDGQAVIWEHVEPIIDRPAQEIIADEFKQFYRREIVAGASSHEDFDRYAEASSNRILKQLQGSRSAEAVDVLNELSRNSDHALLKEIQASTNMNWTLDPKKFNWISQVFQGIAARISRANQA